MIDPLTFFRKGLFLIREAAYLELLARAGDAGLPLPVIARTMGEVTSTAHVTCYRLMEKGFLNPPTKVARFPRDSNTWTISPAGLDLIALQTSVNLIR